MFNPDDLIRDEVEYPAQSQQLQQHYMRSQADQLSLLRIRTRLLEQRSMQQPDAEPTKESQGRPLRDPLDEPFGRPAVGQFHQPPVTQPTKQNKKATHVWYRVALVAVLCAAILSGLWYALKQLPAPSGQPVKPHATPTAAPRHNPPIDDITAIEMTSSTSGWARVMTNNYQTFTIARTTDGGQTWHPFDFHGQQAGLMGSFFLDDQTAWVILGSGSDPHTNVAAVRTTDGGQHWQSLQLPPSKTSIMFTDRQHGWSWEPTPLPHIQASRTMYRTVDGGKTWTSFSVMDTTRAPGDATPGPLPFDDALGLTFVTPQHGWAILSSVNGISRSYLYQTQDGGTTWELQQLPQPTSGPIPGIHVAMQNDKKSGAYAAIMPPQFFSPQQGTLTITSQLNAQSPGEIYLYATNNGGQNWSPLGTNIEGTGRARAIMFDTTHLLLDKDLLEDKTVTTYVLINNQWQKQHVSNLGGLITFASVSGQHGWVYTKKSSGKQVVGTLYTTSDDGNTWQQVMQNVTTPPPPTQGG